jgi:hypothetical protein
MQEIETVRMPFSPSNHPLFARFIVNVIEHMRIRTVLYPGMVYTANNGELVAAETQKPLPTDCDLSGLSVPTIISELETLCREQESLVTIYTGPLPPQDVKERVFTPMTS